MHKFARAYLLSGRSGHHIEAAPVSGAPTFLDLQGQSVADIQNAWDSIAANYADGDNWGNFVGFGGQGAGAVDKTKMTNTVWVTSANGDTSDPGTMRWALQQPNSHIKFAIVDSIVDSLRTGFNNVADNVWIDGRGYPGTIYGAIRPSNADNIVGMYLSITQPFAYGKNPSGGCVGCQNVLRSVWYRCNLWDSGDVLYTNGAYYFKSYPGGFRPGPYYHTVQMCRLGPNPGWYAMMAPRLASQDPALVIPGYLNIVNNDARNGKVIESAIDHKAIFDLKVVTYDQLAHHVYGTFHKNVVQGGRERNLKARGQYLHANANVVACYGSGNPIGGGNYGQGSNSEDDAVITYSGGVYVPYSAGDQFLGFTHADQDANGITHWQCDDPSGTEYYAANYSGDVPKNTENVRLLNQWCYSDTAGTIEMPRDTPHFTSGLDWTQYYDLSYLNTSTYANARSLVNELEYPTTGYAAGNPCSADQPRKWSEVYGGSMFAAP